MARIPLSKEMQYVFLFYARLYASLNFNNDRHIGLFTGATIALRELNDGVYPIPLDIYIDSPAKRGYSQGYYAFSHVKEAIHSNNFEEFIGEYILKLL